MNPLPKNPSTESTYGDRFSFLSHIQNFKYIHIPTSLHYPRGHITPTFSFFVIDSSL